MKVHLSPSKLFCEHVVSSEIKLPRKFAKGKRRAEVNVTKQILKEKEEEMFLKESVDGISKLQVKILIFPIVRPLDINADLSWRDNRRQVGKPSCQHRKEQKKVNCGQLIYLSTVQFIVFLSYFPIYVIIFCVVMGIVICHSVVILLSLLS